MVDSDPLADIETRSNKKGLFDFYLERDFREDFLTSPSDTLEKNTLTDEDISFMQSIPPANDLAAMAEQYDVIKEGLTSRIEQPPGQRKETVIEGVALRVLRHYLLIEESEQNRSEAQWLLEVLVNLRSVDIDVLADAYNYAKPTMTEEGQETVLDYLVDLHNAQIQRVKTEYPGFKADYENAASETEKRQALFHGKSLERLSKACHYARQEVAELADRVTI